MDWLLIKKLRSTAFASPSLCSSSSSNDSPIDYTTEESEEEGQAVVQCVVCLYNLNNSNGERCRVLGDCKHEFHQQCIDAWLQNNPTCPLCRCPVPYACPTHQQQLSHDDHRQALHYAILSCLLALLDHLCNWFVNPLGFDRACEDDRYVI